MRVPIASTAARPVYASTAHSNIVVRDICIVEAIGATVTPRKTSIDDIFICIVTLWRA